MKVLIEKPYEWDDYTGSDPVGDIKSIVSHFGFDRCHLYLTHKSIGDLFCHPDTGRVYKHDWKYLFQVDEVELSTTGYDYLGDCK